MTFKYNHLDNFYSQENTYFYYQVFYLDSVLSLQYSASCFTHNSIYITMVRPVTSTWGTLKKKEDKLY